MRNRVQNVLLATLAAMLMLASCVSSPDAKPGLQPPAWALRTPAPDSTYTYFVGNSSAGDGNVSVATDAATANLISSIMTYMGVKVSVDSSATAKATLDSYQADIVQTVRAESSGRIAGFQVKEKTLVKEASGAITVYILASYITTDLEKEKARIAATFKEREDAVAKPEAAGDSAVASGRWFDAVKSYVEAAVVASGSGIDNADVKMERNVNKARGVLAKLRFVRVDGPAAADLGKDYAKPFSAKLVYGEGDAAPGIPGAEVFAVYQRRQASGRVITKTERVLTDARGVAVFTPPAPDFVGKATFTFSLNLDSTRELLERIPAKYDAYVDAITDDLSRRSLSFEYVIASQAKTVPTGVAIVDLTDDGKPAATLVAQGGLFETLAKEKFKTGLAALDAALIVSMDDTRILSAAKAQYASGLARYIYGTARIESAVKDGSMWQATARMTVRCVEFATGIILYATEKTAIAVGTDEASARRAALLQVSRDAIAKDLMANLP